MGETMGLKYFYQLLTNTYNKMDITNETPQILTIKSVTYTWVKTVDGQETVSGSSDLPITDAIVAEVQSIQAPDFNITVTK